MPTYRGSIMIYKIVNENVSLEIEAYENGEVNISIADPENLCADNGYGGNYACIDLSA